MNGLISWFTSDSSRRLICSLNQLIHWANNTDESVLHLQSRGSVCLLRANEAHKGALFLPAGFHMYIKQTALFSAPLRRVLCAICRALKGLRKDSAGKD